MRTRLMAVAMAVVLVGVSAPALAYDPLVRSLAATFGDVVTGTGSFGLNVINHSTAAGALGIAGLMDSPSADITSIAVRGVNLGQGSGVLGSHSATTGTEPGVRGKTNSTSALAVGVVGQVTSTSPGDQSAGVRGINNGTGSLGFGVWGSQSGNGIGVFGQSNTGRAVQGFSGSGIGVIGDSTTRGVVGTLNQTSCGGTSFGVGGCGADVGIGVLGDSNTRGVVGTLGHTSCAGVYAVGGCSNNDAVGVHGAADSGRAVEGFSNGGIGVIGDSNARGVVGTLGRTSCAGVYAVGGCVGNAQAYGVFGRAAHNSGVVGSTDDGNVFKGVRTTSEIAVARIDSNGRGYFNGGTQNSGADVAEYIPVTDKPQPGDVVEIDLDHPGQFRLATVANSTAVAGVITTRPGMSLSKGDVVNTNSTAPQLALVGRVPVKVTTQNGVIHAGDLLVSSSMPGYAMRAPANPAVGTIIGKALGELKSGTGTIELLVMLR